MTESGKTILSLIIGVFLGAALAILLTNKVPFYVSEFLPVFIAALTAAFIDCKKGWRTGVIIAFIMAMLSIIAYLAATYAEIKTALKIISDTRVAIGYLLFIPIGIAGSYTGYCVKTLFKKLNTYHK
ncbi:MAG: hypothetical protein JXR79_05985 [Nitrospirae bacterium]|nr:hypothetical protein [Nitrospirota bacterium]